MNVTFTKTLALFTVSTEDLKSTVAAAWLRHSVLTAVTEMSGDDLDQPTYEDHHYGDQANK